MCGAFNYDHKGPWHFPSYAITDFIPCGRITRDAAMTPNAVHWTPLEHAAWNALQPASRRYSWMPSATLAAKLNSSSSYTSPSPSPIARAQEAPTPSKDEVRQQKKRQQNKANKQKRALERQSINDEDIEQGEDDDEEEEDKGSDNEVTVRPPSSPSRRKPSSTPAPKSKVGRIHAHSPPSTPTISESQKNRNILACHNYYNDKNENSERYFGGNPHTP